MFYLAINSFCRIRSTSDHLDIISYTIDVKLCSSQYFTKRSTQYGTLFLLKTLKKKKKLLYTIIPTTHRLGGGQLANHTKVRPLLNSMHSHTKSENSQLIFNFNVIDKNIKAIGAIRKKMKQ